VNRGERTLTPDELKKYMEALGDTSVDQLLKLHIYAGGQRMIQLARAKVSDYTPDTGTLRIWDSKGKRRAAREHLIPLATEGKAILKNLAISKAPDAKLFVSERAAGDRIAEIRTEMGGAYFDARDLRRTCETILAGMGITKETRAHLLSHGLGGVQDAVYDKHAYTKEKRAALEAWEAKLAEITEGEAEKRKNVTSITKKKKAA
jgi:integrase